MNSLISPSNNIIIFAIVLGAATFGIYSEHKKWFGKISGILVTMLTMSALSMAGVVPVASDPKIKVEVYSMVTDYFIPIAIPMLLFSSNIVRIIKESGKLLIAFLLGAFGVILGSIIAFHLINLGEGSANTAGVISATLIGGSINFFAAAEILNFSTHPLFTATVAVDNFAANLYILLLFTIPSIKLIAPLFAKPKTENTKETTLPEAKKNEDISFENITLTLFFSVLTVSAAYLISPFFQKIFKTDIDLSLLVITVLAITIANIFPNKLKKLENTAFSIGLLFMYIFLAVIGAATNLHDILHVGPLVLLFYLVIMFFHLFFMFAIAKLFKLDVYEVIISSAANIMGPSVAAPMAASLGQKKLITPAVLVGILGYVIGTFVGVWLAMFLG